MCCSASVMEISTWFVLMKAQLQPPQISFRGTALWGLLLPRLNGWSTPGSCQEPPLLLATPSASCGLPLWLCPHILQLCFPAGLPFHPSGSSFPSQVTLCLLREHLTAQFCFFFFGCGAHGCVARARRAATLGFCPLWASSIGHLAIF